MPDLLPTPDPAESYLPVVAGVAAIGDQLLRLLFSDGTVGDVDFSAERWTGVLEPLNDPAYFAQVRVDAEAGTIVWPDGLDLAPEPLYEQARAHPLVAPPDPAPETSQTASSGPRTAITRPRDPPPQLTAGENFSSQISPQP
jgi:uncharacterized protein DUF2442